MTIRSLLKATHAETASLTDEEFIAWLEKLPDDKLSEYLLPQIQVVEQIRPTKVKSTIIDVSGQPERKAKQNESVQEYMDRMMKMMTQMMG